MSLYSADAFLRFPPGYGIPIQKNTVLSGHLPNLHCWVPETARFVSQEVVVGDLLSALERIFCCPGPGQLKLLGEPGQPGFSSHDFLGSGTGTKIKRHRFNRSLVGGNMSDFPIILGNSESFQSKTAIFWDLVFEILWVSRVFLTCNLLPYPSFEFRSKRSPKQWSV